MVLVAMLEPLNSRVAESSLRLAQLWVHAEQATLIGYAEMVLYMAGSPLLEGSALDETLGSSLLAWLCFELEQALPVA